MRWFHRGSLLIACLGPAAPAHAQAVIAYYHTDHLGSVRMTTDAQRVVVDRHDYLPFGEETADAPNNRIKFTGKYRDETGYDYFGARYYNATLGRFASIDPARPQSHEPQTGNRYAYVTNNPLRYDDPDGRLKRDKSGRLIFEKTAEGYVEHAGAPRVRFHVESGYLFANDGRKIPALRSIDTQDPRFQCDCHGLTFADGQFWINDPQVNDLLRGDHYVRTDKPRVGDVGIYRDARGHVVHSVTVTAVDKKGKVTQVSGLGGIELEAHSDKPEPGPGGGWYDLKATIEYWHKVGDTRSEVQRRQNVEKVIRYKKLNP